MHNRIHICEELGFCGGVRNAVWKSVLSIQREKKTIIFGDLIHNDRVLHELFLNDVQIVKDLQQILPNSRIIIPAHGITKEKVALLHERTQDIIDMTCPMVVNMRNKLIHLSHMCDLVILLGRKNHTEIVGAISFSQKEKIFVIESLQELISSGILNQTLQHIPQCKVGLISQTTASSSEFDAIQQWLTTRESISVHIENTLCPTVIKRQKNAEKYARISDAIIVVGDRRSSNTYSLFEIAQSINPHSFFVPSNSPMVFEDKETLVRAKSISILAGTSSPYYVLDETVESLQQILSEHTTKEAVIVIYGPTAVGKTEFTEILSKKISSEIINFDSMQVYKHLAIGTARPNEGSSDIPHHLFGYIDPKHRISVADYQKEAIQKIQQVFKRNRIPILVGGSYLYASSLIDGLFEMEQEKNFSEVRLRLFQECQEIGLYEMYNKLLQIDPQAAQKIHSNDKKRILRALEVYELTGKPISLLQKESTKKAPFFFVKLGLLRSPEVIYSRIHNRTKTMFQEGMLEEVKWLLANGYKESLYEIKAHGYRECVEYLEKKRTLEETVELMEKNTRHYAKRQLTWLRQRSDFHLLNLDASSNIQSIGSAALKMIEMAKKHSQI
ncbi:MAG TPA: tRNA (adenosine(37)-N6)-dimethylallyltransferase MiaA [Caldisericia bacterium]|nr:tRNA (adenosine(37)-N6)-dimethylallyltransferase MiaA [Caldisericia bacterium]